MVKYCKLIVLVLFLGLANKGFSEYTPQYCAYRSTTVRRLTQVHKTDDKNRFPSHGFALIILRYNESSTGKISIHAPLNLLLQNITNESAHRFDGFHPSDDDANIFPWKLQEHLELLSAQTPHSPPANC